MTGSESDVPRCTACGAAVVAGQARCWLCLRNASEAIDENPYASPRPIAGENVSGQVSLASLFLVMTLVAVGLGLFMQAPGLGVLFAFVATPALIRTFIATNLSKRTGRRLNTLGKVETFIVSLFIVGAVGLASFTAFAAVCLAGAGLLEATRAPVEVFLIVGLGGGLVAAIAVATFLFRLTGPNG